MWKFVKMTWFNFMFVTYDIVWLYIDLTKGNICGAIFFELLLIGQLTFLVLDINRYFTECT